jgi:hypothetical protein
MEPDEQAEHGNHGDPERAEVWHKCPAKVLGA